MRVFWGVLAVVGALSATEASAANWNEGTIHLPDGLMDQLERSTVWQRELGEPEPAPIVLAEGAEADQPRCLRRGAHGLRRFLERYY
jgi:hypothetical protein